MYIDFKDLLWMDVKIMISTITPTSLYVLLFQVSDES